MPFGLGFGETLLILAVILLFFGPKRLPDAAASLGKGIREFKDGITGNDDNHSGSTNQASALNPPQPNYQPPKSYSPPPAYVPPDQSPRASE